MRYLPLITSALAASALSAALIAAPAKAQDIGSDPSVISVSGPRNTTRRPVVARGLIVELKPDADTANPNLQTPQAVHDRLAAVARTAGLPVPDVAPRQVF
jgi:uncharacterized protein YggE